MSLVDEAVNGVVGVVWNAGLARSGKMRAWFTKGPVTLSAGLTVDGGEHDDWDEYDRALLERETVEGTSSCCRRG